MCNITKFPVNGFKRVKNPCQFDKDFTENYNEDTMKDIFSKLMLNILKN